MSEKLLKHGIFLKKADPRVEYIAKFAKESYLYESGTKKAVDEGNITMKELEIYHYLTAWANERAPIFDDCKETEKAYMQTLEEAYPVAAKLYSISEADARSIFEKVSDIPASLPRDKK
ncbi:MAG: hypothetical protein WCX97_03505 [Candidatus Magasanikbacteria bacterium]